MGEREQRYYHSLYEAAVAVNSAFTPQDALRSIVQNVAEGLDARGCELMLLTPDRSLLLHTAAYGLSERYVQKKGPVSADKSITEAIGNNTIPYVGLT